MLLKCVQHAVVLNEYRKRQSLVHQPASLPASLLFVRFRFGRNRDGFAVFGMRLGSDLLRDLRDAQIGLFMIRAEFQCALIITQRVHQAMRFVQGVAAPNVSVGQCREQSIIRILPDLLFELCDLGL